MPSPQCVLCDVPITEANDSREHVIPNSIGGRLRTRGFICTNCNNSAGETWDADLARQLNPLCLFFGIVRERGVPPPQIFETTAGEKFIHSVDGLSPARPTYKEEHTDAGIRIDIVARTKREARKMLEGLKRKYPQADIAALLAQATVRSSYPKGMVTFGISFGGETAGRSLVKTAAAFAHRSGVAVSDCCVATKYLRDASASACFGYYYQDDLVVPRPSGVPLHCVAVSGNPTTGLLLGYIEYFGVQRVVVCLSDTYRGSAINLAHAVDPMTGSELGLSVQLPFSVADIEAIYDYQKMPDGALEQAFSGVLPTGLKKHFEAEQQRVVHDAVQYAFANCGAKEGEILTEEHIRKLSGLAAHKMMPFILRNLRRPPR